MQPSAPFPLFSMERVLCDLPVTFQALSHSRQMSEVKNTEVGLGVPEGGQRGERPGTEMEARAREGEGQPESIQLWANDREREKGRKREGGQTSSP